MKEFHDLMEKLFSALGKMHFRLGSAVPKNEKEDEIWIRTGFEVTSYFVIHQAEDKEIPSKDLGVRVLFSRKNTMHSVPGFFISLELYKTVRGIGVKPLASIRFVRFKDTGLHRLVKIHKQEFDRPEDAGKTMSDIGVFLESIRLAEGPCF